MHSAGSAEYDHALRTLIRAELLEMLKIVII